MAFVEFEQRGHVGLITINRPEVLNALNLEVIEQLDDILLRAESQEDVHVIVITGAGRSFVAGADIGEMVNYTADDAKRFSHHGNNTMMHITRFPSPVIAAVNGFALGGGCELAMSCDIILAAGPNAEGKGGAKFGQPEVGLGITPGFGGTQRLARLVGPGMAKQLIYTAKNIKAVKINFRPSSTVRPDIAATRAGQKIDFYDLEALVNKGDGEGGSSGGGSGSGDGGGSDGDQGENPLG